jgi:phosphate transport system substrate-binding protein
MALVALVALTSPISPLPPTAQAGSRGSGTDAQPSAVRIGGSSTVFPILAAAIQAFRQAGHSAPITLKESGTTDGFRQFCLGRLEVAMASRPINGDELGACRTAGVTFIELPIAFDAISVVVHPTNTWAKEVSTKELARLWGRQAQGRVNRWSEVNSAWPDRPIKLCGPGKDSGTFDYFNKAINGSPAHSRLDYSASEDDNIIVRCIASNPNSLGYFGLSYYRANRDRLRLVAVRSAKGPLLPTVANVQAGRYQPLSRPLFLYVNDKALAERDEMRQFTTFVIRNGLRFVQQVGDVPLPDSTYQLVESKLYKRITGTAFAGELPVGLSIGEAMRRSFDRTKRPQFR